jgi:hypothetical protein
VTTTAFTRLDAPMGRPTGASFSALPDFAWSILKNAHDAWFAWPVDQRGRILSVSLVDLDGRAIVATQDAVYDARMTQTDSIRLARDCQARLGAICGGEFFVTQSSKQIADGRLTSWRAMNFDLHARMEAMSAHERLSLTRSGWRVS